jgi:hypothetical protein
MVSDFSIRTPLSYLAILLTAKKHRNGRRLIAPVHDPHRSDSDLPLRVRARKAQANEVQNTN